MQRHRWFVLIGWIGILLALLGTAYPILHARGPLAAAQEDGTAPTTTTEATPDTAMPVASPTSATPVADQVPAEAPEFISGRWRIAVSFASKSNDVPNLELEGRSGRDWIVIIADVSNWSGDNATLAPADFGIRAAGEENAGGFARQTTEEAAARLSIEPRNTGDGVDIAEGDTERLVLVFRIDSTDAELFGRPARGQGAP
jgi:hypothetical protein